MNQIIQKLFAPNKGIFANDASVATLSKRFQKYGIDPTIENRTAFRKLLYTTPEIENYLSGVILNEEALSFIPVLSDRGLLPGVKVDKGLLPFGAHEENTVGGIDDLQTRLTEHKKNGATFTKWRAAFAISPSTPTQEAIDENIQLLTAFAKKSLSEELVPILEPEVLMQGEHSIEDGARVTSRILSSLFTKLEAEQIDVSSLILKTNMILPGEGSPASSPETTAQQTISVLSQTVPADIGGIVFLSGGQTSDQAIENFHAICSAAHKHAFLTPLTFSFERVFEEPVLALWSKNLDDRESAQQVFLHMAQQVSNALKT